MIRYFTTACLLMFASSLASGQDGWDVHYKIYDTKNKKAATVSDIVDAMQVADVMFFGEEHDDSIGHRLEDTIYRALLHRYGNVALSMEMFERDCQLVVDEYLQDFITDAMVVKEGRAWNNYKDYRPLVNAAKQAGSKVIAANAPRRYVNLVSRKGLAALEKLPLQSKMLFARTPIDTINTLYFKKFSDLMGGMHSGRNIYYSQTLWDATMAESINRYWHKHKTQKIFHLNGRFHTDERLGTYTQLARMNRRLKLLNISCFAADDFGDPNWDEYARLGDFIIVTDPSIPKSF